MQICNEIYENTTRELGIMIFIGLVALGGQACFGREIFISPPAIKATSPFRRKFEIPFYICVQKKKAAYGPEKRTKDPSVF